MYVRQPLGVGVTGHHNVRFFGQQSLERIEKLFLCAVLVGKKLNVVNKEQVQRVVALLELVKSLALVSFNHIRHKLFCVDVENFGLRVVNQQFVANRMHQVRLAKANAAVNKQGVVKLAQAAGNVHGSRAAHAVGCAFNQTVESQGTVKPILERRARSVVRSNHVGRLHDGRSLKAGSDNQRSGRGFARSKR